jgi:hypothetical protein
MIKKSRPTKQSANPYLTASSIDELSPASRIAYEIVAERRDLLPSVERIMNAELGHDATVHALTMFRDSLSTIGDPHRDPRVAIADASTGASSPS